MENGVCSHLSVALGGCGPKPVVALDEQAAQIGKPINADSVERLGQALAKAADPVDDVRASSEYRRLVIPRMLAKTIARAVSPRKERRS
jgi:CO/xanthine dehydrogenase FAD-binding subunit